MLEKLNQPGYEFISRADDVVLEFLGNVLGRNPDPVFYEVGIGIGATTLPVAQLMNNRGKIFLFSLQRDVKELTADLNARGFFNIDASWGSPHHTFSGYHFELARGLINKSLPRVDVAYIDGGHVFHLDAPATCVLKELCNLGGYLIFDDYAWSLARSPSLKPEKRPATAKEYDALQIEACHVAMVCQAFMDTDSRYKMVHKKGDTYVYQRIA